MDRMLTTLDAQFETLDAHLEGVGNAEAAGEPAGLPALAPFVRETGTGMPELLSTPLPHDEEEMDGVIFAALISPYV